MKNSQAIERVEKDLLSVLLDYAVPFLNKKIKIAKPAAVKNGLESFQLCFSAG